jgi:ADP-heptose:LPS heptosyltransferase
MDQGIGDQILFSSLIPDLIRTGADLTIECDTRLIPLLKRSFPQLPTRPLNDAPTAADNDGFAHQVYVPDSARWLRTSFDDFPRLTGYLKADPQLTHKLRADYLRRSEGRPIIGISWRTAANTKISDHKTIELEAWAPLLAQQAMFVSLQYGDCRYEIGNAVRKLGRPLVVDDSVDAVKDMDACAAQVAAMDLVITTSNATAHVAGSLNVPVWTLVPKGYGFMWHWFLNRDDSPWYPSMRLLRQNKQGDWGPVLDRAAAMLASFIAAGRP